MSVVAISGGVVNLEGATSVTVKSSAWSFVPKAMAVPVIGIAIYFMALCAAGIIGVFFPAHGSIPFYWSGFASVAGFLSGIVAMAAVILSGARFILHGSDHPNVRAVMRGIFITGFALCLMAATINLVIMHDWQTASGSSPFDYTMRTALASGAARGAAILVIAALAFLLSVLSLRLLDLKNVTIVGEGEMRRITNLTGDDVSVLMNSLPR